MSTILLAALAVVLLVIAVPVFTFARAVLKVHGMPPQRPQPLWPIDASAVPANVAEAWAGTLAVLEGFGFSLATYGQMRGQTGTGPRLLAFAIHVCREHGHSTLVTATGAPGAAAEDVAISVVLRTRLDGDAEVVTSNWALPKAWPSEPHIRSFQFPGLDDVSILYEAHQRLVARVGGEGARGVLPEPGTELRAEHERSIAGMEYAVRCGHLQPTGDGGYRKTWRGSVYSAFHFLPGLQERHMERVVKDALGLLGELGVQPTFIESCTVSEVPELGALSSPEFERLLEAAKATYPAKHEAVMKLGMAQATSWHVDVSGGVVRFMGPGGAGLEGRGQILGSYESESGTWEWAWYHPDVPESWKQDSIAVKRYGEEHSLAPLTTGIIRATLPEAWQLVIVAAEIVNPQGVYAGPLEGTVLAVTFRDLRAVRESGEHALIGAGSR